MIEMFMGVLADLKIACCLNSIEELCIHDRKSVLNLYYQLLLVTFSEIEGLDTYFGVQIFYDAIALA